MSVYQSEVEMPELQRHALQLPDAEIHYHASFIDFESASRLFEELLHHTAWRQERIRLFGKTNDVPRLSLWVADDGLEYAYSNLTMQAQPWPEALSPLRRNLHSICGVNFNSVLLNYYRDGQDSNGWHSDDEIELGANPMIASVTLGGARDFKLRHKTNKNLQYTIELAHGSLLLMSGSTQEFWQHTVPKRAHAQPRINLTFRTIKKTR